MTRYNKDATIWANERDKRMNEIEQNLPVVAIKKQTNWEHWGWKEIIPACVFLGILWLISIQLGFLCSLLYIGILFQTWSPPLEKKPDQHQPELPEEPEEIEVKGFVRKVINESTIAFLSSPQDCTGKLNRYSFYAGTEIIIEGINTSELCGGYNYASSGICFKCIPLGIKLYPDEDCGKIGLLHCKIVGNYRLLTERDWI